MANQIEERIKKLNDKLVERLESFFGKGVEVFQDEVNEDETDLSRINHVVFETLGFKRVNHYTLQQVVNVYYFSENREDLDLLQVQFMNALDGTGHTCDSTDKGTMQKKNTKQFVDVLTFELTRMVKNVC
ncbi:hypothetical protein ACQKFK_15165 [Bacillus mycoides]|uniref:hypothetical protein n=1 Tax=Bacillus TaxID=1386 RepID=UPI001C016679|nr:hypothetical protein [Bacillus mycoides]MED1382069.1 hypothetical protein [Bacillus mycoides]QWH77295.1 hypothetical protein EXW59_11645 [Bacillus mycoides]QWI42344.1 hypothetical protein EXW55_04905 [Bacillus mycoides]